MNQDDRCVSSGKQSFLKNSSNGLIYYTIPSFERTNLVRHGFSSRIGGVSTGECSTLNLGLKRKDTPENVQENFRLLGRALEIVPDQMVFTDQVHKNQVLAVNTAHRGMGLCRVSDIRETDGLVTNQPGVALVTYYADCVPLFFLDPVQKAIGLSHSGWRGTVAKIGRQTLKVMEEHYGTRAEDCLVGIGPSIGACCFEVDSPVVKEFATAFVGLKDELVQSRGGGKYDVNLWQANRVQLEQCGVKKENITTASLCTSCNTDMFFSHRKENGRTGSMAALLMLR